MKTSSFAFWLHIVAIKCSNKKGAMFSRALDGLSFFPYDLISLTETKRQEKLFSSFMLHWSAQAFQFYKLTPR